MAAKKPYKHHKIYLKSFYNDLQCIYMSILGYGRPIIQFISIIQGQGHTVRSK